MTQITAKLPESLVKDIDAAAEKLRRSRADIVRQAIEYYLADVQDLAKAVETLRDPADPIMDWEKVKRELLAKN